MLPTNRSPTSPGEILVEEFLKPSGMSQTELAKKMGLPVQHVNLIVKGKRGITATTAVLLSRVFNNSPQLWMNLQTNYDLWRALHKNAS